VRRTTPTCGGLFVPHATRDRQSGFDGVGAETGGRRLVAGGGRALRRAAPRRAAPRRAAPRRAAVAAVATFS